MRKIIKNFCKNHVLNHDVHHKEVHASAHHDGKAHDVHHNDGPKRAPYTLTDQVHKNDLKPEDLSRLVYPDAMERPKRFAIHNIMSCKWNFFSQSKLDIILQVIFETVFKPIAY